MQWRKASTDSENKLRDVIVKNIKFLRKRPCVSLSDCKRRDYENSLIVQYEEEDDKDSEVANTLRDCTKRHNEAMNEHIESSKQRAQEKLEQFICRVRKFGDALQELNEEWTFDTLSNKFLLDGLHQDCAAEAIKGKVVDWWRRPLPAMCYGVVNWFYLVEHEEVPDEFFDHSLTIHNVWVTLKRTDQDMMAANFLNEITGKVSSSSMGSTAAKPPAKINTLAKIDTCASISTAPAFLLDRIGVEHDSSSLKKSLSVRSWGGQNCMEGPYLLDVFIQKHHFKSVEFYKSLDHVGVVVISMNVLSELEGVTFTYGTEEDLLPAVAVVMPTLGIAETALEFRAPCNDEAVVRLNHIMVDTGAGTNLLEKTQFDQMKEQLGDIEIKDDEVDYFAHYKSCGISWTGQCRVDVKTGKHEVPSVEFDVYKSDNPVEANAKDLRVRNRHREECQKMYAENWDSSDLIFAPPMVDEENFTSCVGQPFLSRFRSVTFFITGTDGMLCISLDVEPLFRDRQEGLPKVAKTKHKRKGRRRTETGVDVAGTSGIQRRRSNTEVHNEDEPGSSGSQRKRSNTEANREDELGASEPPRKRSKIEVETKDTENSACGGSDEE